MSRKEINIHIRKNIENWVTKTSTLPTRDAIQQLAQSYNVPKQVVSGNISWIVSSKQLQIFKDKPNSYLY